jgi:hypothetical protein
MSFVAMGAAAGTAFATGTLGAVVGGTGAALGGIAGGALGGAALGAGVGAAGAGITGGDVGKGALMGAGSGALTGGIGTAVATPATIAAQAGTALPSSAATNASQTIASQLVDKPVANIVGHSAANAGNTVGAGGSIVGGTTGAAPVGATPVLEAAKTGIVNPSVVTQIPGVNQIPGVSGIEAGGLSNLQNAGLVGGSRFGVGLASGEDAEQAGIAGLTSGATAGAMGQFADLSANADLSQGVTTPDVNVSGGVLKTTGIGPDGLEYAIKPGDLEYGELANINTNEVHLGGAKNLTEMGKVTDYSDFWANIEATNPKMMGIGKDIEMHDFTAAQGSGGRSFLPTDPTAAQLAPVGDPIYGQTGMGDRAGNLGTKFGTWDSATDSIKEIAPAGVTSTGGLAAMSAANELSPQELQDLERKKKLDAAYSRLDSSYRGAGQIPAYVYRGGRRFNEGGIVGLTAGSGDGTSDSIPAVVGNTAPARLSDGEFVVPADIVSHLGNGSSEAGAKSLYDMMNDIRAARTGTRNQPKDIDPYKYIPT